MTEDSLALQQMFHVQDAFYLTQTIIKSTLYILPDGEPKAQLEEVQRQVKELAHVVEGIRASIGLEEQP